MWEPSCRAPGLPDEDVLGWIRWVGWPSPLGRNRDLDDRLVDELLQEYFFVRRAPAEEVLAAADKWTGIESARIIEEDGDESLFGFVVTGPCVASTVADVDALPRHVSAENGRGGGGGEPEVAAGGLTDRQLQVLRTAYAKGFFDRPRRGSAGECAAALEIAQSTFSQHLREAERKIMDWLVGDPP